jgi:MraZ protein
MIVGSYSGILSPKRRTAIPKRILTELGSKVIIAKWYENCLVLVSTDTWHALLKRLVGEGQLITTPVRDTERFILGSAFEIEPDSQGRAVIPQTLIEFAGLTDRLVFIGLGDKVEIWDEVKWLEKEKEVAGKAEELIENLANKK